MMHGEGQLEEDTGKDGVLMRSNFATMVVFEAIVTVQGPVPEHPPPLQPENIDPLAGAAVNSPGPLNGALCVLQPGPQFMPAGTDVTVPLPGPFLVMVSVGLRVTTAPATAPLSIP